MGDTLTETLDGRENGSPKPVDARVIREPLTYDAEVTRSVRGGLRVRSKGENRSYFQDVYRLERHGDNEARARLERHGREMDVELRGSELDLHPEARYESAPEEARAPLASYAAPPLWLIREFATAPRPARVLADLVPSFDLPPGVFSVNLPRATQTTSETQEALGGAASSTDIAGSLVTSPVTTIAGFWDVPIQVLEQSPQGAHFDWVAFTQLAEDYDAALEAQILNGSGGGNSLLGILNNPDVPSTHKIAYTDSTPTTIEMFLIFGYLPAIIGLDRRLPPEYWLMSTPRAAWIMASEDQQQRPLSLPMAMTDQAGEPGDFDLLSYPVEQDNAIPRTMNGNQEPVLLTRPSDMLLLEGAPRTGVMYDVLSGTLEVRLAYRNYAAFLLRHPESVAWMTGTGMVPTTGY